MHLEEMVVQRCICDRRKMKNCIKAFVVELLAPIEGRQILRDEIAAVTGEILKVTRAEIIDHRETRVREFFLQGEREIGADETGPAGDNEVGRRVQCWKIRIGER